MCRDFDEKIEPQSSQRLAESPILRATLRTLRLLPFLSLACCMLVGCEQKMARQPRYNPLDASDFFGDGRSARPVVPGTVARGQLRDDVPFFTGRKDAPTDAAQAARAVAAGGTGNVAVVLSTAAGLAEAPYVETIPVPVTKEFLERGRERYGIFCIHCHGRLGHADGRIVERGFTKPPSFHTDIARGRPGKLRDQPVGYYFEVVTNGYGAMPDHAAQIPPRDRWAIVGYIRALQLSQHEEKSEIRSSKPETNPNHQITQIQNCR